MPQKLQQTGYLLKEPPFRMKYFMAMALTISPVYWIPWLGISEFIIVKYVILCIMMIAGLLKRRKNVFSSSRNPAIEALIVAGFFALFAELVYQNEAEMAVQILNAFRFLILPIFLLAYLGYLAKNLDELIEIGILSSWMMIVLVLYGYVLLLTGNDTSPDERLTIATSFLGGGRTGWSNSISCLAVLYFAIAYLNDLPKHSKVICVVAGLLCLSTQVLVAGRAGILCSLVGLVLCATIAGKKKHVVCFIVVCAGFSVLWSEWTKQTLRITRSNIVDPTANDISAGRIEQYITAIDLLKNPKTWMFGIEESIYQYYYTLNGRFTEVHNVFLNAAFNYGLIYCGIIAGLTITFCVKAFRHTNPIAKLVIATSVASPIVIMLLEPNSIWRSPTSYIIWWFLVSTVVRSDSRKKEKRFS